MIKSSRKIKKAFIMAIMTILTIFIGINTNAYTYDNDNGQIVTFNLIKWINGTSLEYDDGHGNIIGFDEYAQNIELYKDGHNFDEDGSIFIELDNPIPAGVYNTSCAYIEGILSISLSEFDNASTRTEIYNNVQKQTTNIGVITSIEYDSIYIEFNGENIPCTLPTLDIYVGEQEYGLPTPWMPHQSYFEYVQEISNEASYNEGYSQGRIDGYNNGVSQASSIYITQEQYIFNVIGSLYNANGELIAGGSANFHIDYDFNITDSKSILRLYNMTTYEVGSYIILDIQFNYFMHPIEVYSDRYVNYISDGINKNASISYLGSGYYGTKTLGFENNTKSIKLRYDNTNITTLQISMYGFSGEYISTMDGYEDGLVDGEAYANSHLNRDSVSYKQGYVDGMRYNSDVDFNGLFMGIASTPINTLSSFMNVDLFGLNLFEVFTGIITCLIILWVIKKFI